MSQMMNVSRVVHVSTNIGQKCEFCDFWIGAGSDGESRLADSVNHYIEKHGCKLLHVGTETSHDNNGNPWHSTVAVLGVV